MEFRETLNNAVNQLMNHEYALASSLFKRAIELGAPQCLVDLKAMTYNYMLLPLAFNVNRYYSKEGHYVSDGVEYYFRNLINLRNLAHKDYSYQEDYREALKSLVNIKELFFRAAGLDYHTEILKCETGHFIEESLKLFNMIQNTFDDIITKDALQIRYYLPDTDMENFALDLLEVKAFCLNLLLSYTTVEHSDIQDRGYKATTVINGPFADTTVKKDISVSTFATVCPRLHMLKGKKTHYPEYKKMYDETVAYINRYRKFDSPKDLRDGIRNMVEHKVTSKTGKDYFKFIKKFEKSSKYYNSTIVEIITRYESFFKRINGVRFLSKVISKFTNSEYNPICSFEPDCVFTRKVLKGVCNMIADGKHWDIDTVRTIFAALSFFAGAGVVAYVLFAIAMKFEKYPTVIVEKHC